ncbi:P-loop containing nucleoside triphosphate hydrolase protein [Flagelloscypha sp. PMI_526]|nr:P-loop containing nucleoside triphosphate hydrolase protein [Flagelloscypha sp. PMI_526]
MSPLPVRGASELYIRSQMSPQQTRTIAWPNPICEDPGKLYMQTQTSYHPTFRPTMPSPESINATPQWFHSTCLYRVMGATGTGKSTFINLVSGSHLEIGTDLLSCTSKVHVTQPFQLDGRSVTMIDTPGFDDTTKSDFDVLKMICDYLAESYIDGTKLAGVIYLHRISDNRVGGLATRNFNMFRELCGDTTLKNVVIVTTMWDDVTEERGYARQNQLATSDAFFKAALEKCASILPHFNTIESAHNILRHILGNQPQALQIQREMVDEHKDISQTAAGERMNRQLEELMKKHEEEIERLKQDMEAAMKKKDEETQRELEEESLKLHEQIEAVRADAQKLASQHEVQKRQLHKVTVSEAENIKTVRETPVVALGERGEFSGEALYNAGQAAIANSFSTQKQKDVLDEAYARMVASKAKLAHFGSEIGAESVREAYNARKARNAAQATWGNHGGFMGGAWYDAGKTPTATAQIFPSYGRKDSMNERDGFIDDSNPEWSYKDMTIGAELPVNFGRTPGGLADTGMAFATNPVRGGIAWLRGLRD